MKGLARAWRMELVGHFDSTLLEARAVTEESMFLDALEKDTPQEREAFLQGCGADPALLGRVRMLLAADEKARGILDSTLLPGQAQTPRSEAAGAVVAGRYVLLEKV